MRIAGEAACVERNEHESENEQGEQSQEFPLSGKDFWIEGRQEAAF
jgi:hypothetical protein